MDYDEKIGDDGKDEKAICNNVILFCCYDDQEPSEKVKKQAHISMI